MQVVKEELKTLSHIDSERGIVIEAKKQENLKFLL